MADQINDGGPAFPFLELDGAGMPYQQNPGVTVRDYFAAKAMHQFLQGAVIPAGYDPTNEFASLAAHSYAMADAMLKARSA